MQAESARLWLSTRVPACMLRELGATALSDGWPARRKRKFQSPWRSIVIRSVEMNADSELRAALAIWARTSKGTK
jgi:hypothetical protein